MDCSIIDLKKDIRIALDLNNVSTQLFDVSDIDTLTLEQIIDSKIVDAVRLVESAAPYHLLDSGKIFPDGTDIEWESSAGFGAGRIPLPRDFMRLVAFRMSDWSRTVFSVVDVASPVYAMQHSRFPGIRGNPQSPVVAIVDSPVGLALEFYCCYGGKGVHVEDARYLPMPVVSEDGKISVCEKLKSSVVYRAAALVANTIKDYEASQRVVVLSTELMN